MNKIAINLLKGLRKGYSLLNPDQAIEGRNWKMFSNKEYANQLIYDYLTNDAPCMIARFGATESNCLTNYLGVQQANTNWVDFIKGESLPWWWDANTLAPMAWSSGFFPIETAHLQRFCELMMQDIPEVDILGSWLNQETHFKESLRKAKRVVLEDIEPFFTKHPWTKALEGQRVLVVHPFAETIQSQYKKREHLFENNLLPGFELKTIKSVQTAVLEKAAFLDWFEALEFMKRQIEEIEFDICIIGCGAYGFPLAAHVKRMGKKSFHLAGVTQMLFGIKGKRWEEAKEWPYSNLFNEHWVYPGINEKPKNAEVLEGGAYW